MALLSLPVGFLPYGVVLLLTLFGVKGATMSRRGRPTLSETERRTRRIHVRLSGEAHKVLVRDSGKSEMTNAALIRRRLLAEVAKLQTITTPSDDLIQTIIAQVEQLNHLTHRVNRRAMVSGRKGIEPDAIVALEQVFDALIETANDIANSCTLASHG